MADVAFHPEAQAEYDAALAAYQTRSPVAAARFEAETDRVLGRIAANPDSFPAYDDEHRFTVLRRFPYTVVYQIHGDRVIVVAFAHSSRRPNYWQGRT